MLSVNQIVSVRWADTSVPVDTCKTSFGVLSLVLGITFQEECRSVDDD